MQSRDVKSMQSREIMILRSHIAVLEQYNQYLLESLDDLSKEVYGLSFEIINKGKNRMSAHEEYLEKQELEAAKKAEGEEEYGKEIY